MEIISPSCVPLCGRLGHEFVNVVAWKCNHHGALSAHFTAWHESAEGPIQSIDSEWRSGPFTADADLEELVQSIRTALQRLLS